jgi:hypothetical protein
MPNEITATAARRYGFESWRGRTLLPQRLFVLNYGVSGGEIRRWDLQKVKPMRAVGGASPADGGPTAFVIGDVRPGELSRSVLSQPPSPLTLPLSPHGTAAGVPSALPPAHTRTFWRPADSPQALVEAELHECSSITAAHEWLLHLLTVFESPLMERQDTPAMGDVCFSGPAPTVFLFARGNMVVNVRNAGREIVEVAEVARSMDGNLIAKPQGVRTVGKPAPKARAVDVVKFRTGTRIRVDLGHAVFGATRGAAQPPATMWKVFYTGGDIEARADGVYFGSHEFGPRTLEVYTIEAGAPARYHELRLQVTRA